jgi:hypothetical protein
MRDGHRHRQGRRTMRRAMAAKIRAPGPNFDRDFAVIAV